MSNEVKRYNPLHQYMVEWPTGKYVAVEDYDALLQETERLREKVRIRDETIEGLRKANGFVD